MVDDAREETVPQAGNGEPGTKEAEALAAALNHSAERVQTLWFSFLTFMVYLAIAAGTTTHRMLFLEEPLNLPVLNIKLPLLGFYILTPIIFVIFHFYMLLNLVLLARTAKSFEDSLARAFSDDGELRENFRMRIENTLFVQLLVGGRLEREGCNAKLLSLMALITLALAPVALLLFLQIKFLPYHSEWITWWHRFLLFVDLTLVWTLWPGYRSRWGVRLRPKAAWWLVAPGIGSAVALTYAVMVAAFPDERIYVATQWLHGSTYFDPISDEVSLRDRPKWYAFIAPGNTLALRGEDLIDDAKLAHIEKNEGSTDAQRWVATLPLKGRDLTGANLEGADVRHVDFSDAILNGANLSYAWATKAQFDGAHLKGALLVGTQLQGASFDHALQHTSQWRKLFLQLIQGASIGVAQLQGASLDEAQLQGASLEGAQLQGARLDDAQLQGASLEKAQLQGARLEGAKLQGALLDYAHLQGASLTKAQLQGALLDSASLQGASLYDAQLQGASLENVCVWRADARSAAWKDTRVARPETRPEGSFGEFFYCSWAGDSFAELKLLIAAEVPEGEIRDGAMERIEQHLDPTKTPEGEDEDELAKIWAAREREAPTPEAYEKVQARQWGELGCAAEGAPYVVHALIARLSGVDTSDRDQSDAAKSLASAFLDEAHCPGAHGISPADKADLKKIAAPAAPKAPKP